MGESSGFEKIISKKSKVGTVILAPAITGVLLAGVLPALSGGSIPGTPSGRWKIQMALCLVLTKTGLYPGTVLVNPHLKLPML